MKRAKLRGLRRDAAVVLGTVGTSEDPDVLTRALDDEEPFVREHAAWALARLRASGASLRQRCDAESRRRRRATEAGDGGKTRHRRISGASWMPAPSRIRCTSSVAGCSGRWCREVPERRPRR